MPIDFDNLSQEFNMDNEAVMDSFDQEAIDIENAILGNNIANPDQVLSDNIGKANAILDRIIVEMNRTGMSPRLGEVAGQLIANINQSVGQLYGKNIDIGNLHLKSKLVEYKKREIELKEKMASKNAGGVVNQNLIVTDRETVLKLLRENKENTKLLESKNVEGDKGENDG